MSMLSGAFDGLYTCTGAWGMGGAGHGGVGGQQHEGQGQGGVGHEGGGGGPRGNSSMRDRVRGVWRDKGIGA